MTPEEYRNHLLVLQFVEPPKRNPRTKKASFENYSARLEATNVVSTESGYLIDILLLFVTCILIISNRS